jgi:hypothetical protein
MLTPELVQARRQKGELFLVSLGARKDRAITLAGELLGAAETSLGQSRETLDAAWEGILVEPRDRKLKDALCKLIEDGLAFDVETPVDPIELRRRVFTRATIERRSEEGLDRIALLSEMGIDVGLSTEQMELALFADLKSAHVARAKQPGELVPGGAAALIARFDLAQRQAVLLRATELSVELEVTDRAALRALFRKLKFFRLLFTAEMLEAGKVLLRVDGPFSLFESVTKYGLSLALALPWIEATGKHRMVADLRWGKERLPLRFTVEGDRGAHTVEAPSIPEELATLVRRIADRSGCPWTVAEADVVLDAKGSGSIIPDLVFTHRSKKRKVYLELMGYWSRDALWRRIEMIEKGALRERVIFCASERLRVSESALSSEHAALLTYKGAISITALLDKLDALA